MAARTACTAAEPALLSPAAVSAWSCSSAWVSALLAAATCSGDVFALGWAALRAAGAGLDGSAAAASGGRPRATRSSDRKSTRLNSSHLVISYAVFCLKKKKKTASSRLVIYQRAIYDARH